MQIIYRYLSAAVFCAIGFGATAIAPSSADKAKCFIDSPSDKTITFIFDNTLWQVSNLSSVEVRGSFNGWKSEAKYALTYNSTSNYWYVTLPYSTVKVPGNSGQPEFKFVTNGSTYQSGDGKSFIPYGYIFLNADRNNIVVFDDDDFETIKANSAAANVLKYISDFDLTSREGQEEISNFRRVPGTSNLYRSYHPFKYSKTGNPTEPLRIQYLTQLATETGINSDICLSGNETSGLASYNIYGTTYSEVIPEYYQKIIDNNRVLYVGTVNATTPTYNAVYYRSTEEPLRQWVKEIVDFINSDKSQPPYLIHCRLGTDRTGVFSGILAALCGASWSDIAADYQLTNRMGIKEFRDYHLLQYSFEQMLGVEDIRTIENVSSSLCEYMVNTGTLTQNDINMLRTRLGATNDMSLTPNIEDSTASTEYYNLQGIRVSADTSGLVIARRGNSATLVLNR